MFLPGFRSDTAAIRGRLHYGLADAPEGERLLWPQPPEVPRYMYAGMLLGEQALLTLFALPLGAAFGFGVCALLALRFASDLFRLPLVVSGRTFLFAFLTVAVSAVVSGLAVRHRLNRLDLVQVLKTRE